MSWYDTVTDSVDGLLKKMGPEGEETLLNVGKDVISFLKEHSKELSAIGKDAFLEILALIKKGNGGEARQKLLEAMNVDSLIEAMENNAATIEQIAQAKDARDKFIKDFLITITKSVASKLLLLLL